MNSSTDIRELPSPEQVVEYVDRTGWQKIGSTDATALYELGGNEGVSRQILVPLSTSLVDYDSAVLEVLKRIAEVEGREPFAVSRALENNGIDAVDVFSESAGPGVTSLSEAALLFSGARGLVLAAAASAIVPRAAFGNARPEGAEWYLSKVSARVLPGSFVVSLGCPIEPTGDRAGQSFGEAYGRRVTTMLVAGVDSALDLVRSPDVRSRPEAWRHAVETGVSVDLVEALAAITSKEGTGAARRISVDFAGVLPVTGAQHRSVEVPPGLARPLQEAAEALRRLVQPVSATVVGEVIGFERDRLSGKTAKILGSLRIGEAGVRRATVRVVASSLEDNLLIDSFRNRRKIILEGTVVRRGNRYSMSSVTAADLVPTSE